MMPKFLLLLQHIVSRLGSISNRFRGIRTQHLPLMTAVAEQCHGSSTRTCRYTLHGYGKGK